MPSDVLITPASSKIEFTDGANATKTLKITGTSLNTDTSFAIGATTANNTLSVLGSASIGSSYNVAGPTNGLIVQGNVGIGITSPSNTKLHIVGDWVSGHSTVKVQGITDNTTGYGFYDTAGSRLGYLAYTGAAFEWYNNANVPVIFYSNTLERMRIAADGKVGIGTTSPASKLHIYDSTYSFTRCTNTANAGHYVDIGANSAGQSFLFSYGAYPVLLGTNGTERIRILSDGNVGIGTANPATKLEVYGVVRITESASGSILQIQAGSSALDFASTFYGGTYRPFTFTNGGSEKMRIQSDGNVGIGITSPNASLHIKPTTLGANGFILERYASTAKLVYAYESAADGYLEVRNGSDSIVSKISGYVSTASYFLSNVGVGTASPSSKLHLDDINAPWITISRSGTPTWQLRNNYPNNQYGFSFNNTTAGTVPLFIGAGGNIGLGIDNPSVRLDIASTQANGIVMRYDTTTAYQAWIRPYWNSGTDSRVDFAINRSANVTPDVIMSVGYGTNVGIGTTTPSYRLHVSQAIPTGTTSAPANTSIQVDSNTNNYLSFVNTADNGTYAGLTFVDNNVGGYIVFRNYTGDVSTGSDSLIYGTYQDHIFQTGTTSGINSRNEVLRIKNNGNVGVGVNSPNNKLHVNGSMSIGSGYNTAAPTNGLLVQGNVGIGMTTTNYKLNVSTSAAQGFTLITNASTVGGPQIDIYDATRAEETVISSTDGTTVGSYIASYLNHPLLFGAYASVSPTAKMVIATSGNVGIGVINPLAQLHINEATSGAAALRVDGTNGTLFSVVDDLSDSLMSVNNSAGLPVLEVFADDRVVMGQYGTNDLVVKNNKIGVGTNNPAYALDVQSNINAEPYSQARFLNTNTSTPFGGIIVNGTSQAHIRFLVGSTTWGGSGAKQWQIRVGQAAGTDALSIYSWTTGTDVLYINSSGNVGINNTNPVFKLDVNGTSGFRDSMAFGPSVGLISWGSMGGGTGFGMRAESGRALSLGANGSFDHIVINTSGNVGVGTTGPIARLHVYDTNQSPATGNLLVTSTGGNASIRIDSSSTSQYTYFTLSQGGTGRFELGIVPTSSDFYINPTVQSGANGAAIYVKKADGNVGINSTSPNSPLTVYNNSDVWHFRLGGASGELRMGGQTNSGAVIQAYTPGGSVRDLYLQRDGGNIGVGLNNPSGKVHIYENANRVTYLAQNNLHTARFEAYGTATAIDTTASNGIFFRINGGDIVKFAADGNVGIGTTSPSRKLHVYSSGLSDNTVNPLLLIDGKFTTAGVDSNDIVGIAFRVENSAGGSQTTTCIGSSYQGAGNSLLLQPVSGNVGVGTINPSFKFEIGAGTSDVVVAKLTQGYERVRYNGFDLIGYNDGNLWMLGNNAANALILGASWDWDRQIAIVYTPATTGAAGGSLEIGQLTKNNANFTHGNTRFYTNGVERLRIISNGYVGIGASSPTYKLQIGTVGSLADSIRIGTYLVAKNTRQYIGYTRDDTGLFESAGDGDTPATVKGGVAGIRIVNTTGTLASAYADNSVQLLTHIFNGGSRVVLHANYDGNVGIGTSVPAALLQIGSGTPTSATGGLQFGDDAGARLYRSASGIVTCSGSIEISANASLNGNYGTWTGEINKIQWHSNNLYFVNRGGGSWLFRNSGGSNVFSVDTNGGTSVSGYLSAATYVYATTYLQTNGNLIYPSGYGATLKLEVGNPSSNAWIDGLTLAPGGNVVIAGTLTESSSIRYKENIETISAPILPKLNKIRPVTYNKKDNPNNIEYGIIAEELNELFPEFVNKNENGEVESVNYSRLTVILIKAVKELQEEVEKLKNK